MAKKTPEAKASPQALTVMIGTAGHIDHGKTALVECLTGCRTDSLPEEQRRGMTIDLGFAPCLLPGARRVGIVDVPGHEKFIRNMVAGATGIDVVLLVVAADDGIMPQTREHFEVVELLGVRHGVVALNKVDKAPELVPLVAEDLRRFLAGTLLEGAPIVPVSAITGQGLGELRRALDEAVAAVTPRPADGPFRLPVENVFSRPGIGTVVTGVPVSGTVRLGDRLELLPGRLAGRVRGLQVYHETAAEGRAGQCVAINLAEVPFQEVRRGQVAAAPGAFRPGRFCEARLRYLRSAGRPLVNRAPVKFHTGTSETEARLVLLDKPALAPGEEGLIQVLLDEEVLVAPGDPFVVRLLATMHTVGGGRVIALSDKRRRRLKDYVVEDLAAAEAALDSSAARLERALQGQQAPAAAAALARAASLTLPEVEGLLAQLAAAGQAWRTRGAGHWIHEERLRAAGSELEAAARAFHAAQPRRAGATLVELQRQAGLPPELFEMALERLIAAKVLRREGAQLAAADWRVPLTPAQEDLCRKLAEAFRKAGANSPSPERDLEALGGTAEERRDLARLLADRGELVEAPGGLFFHPEVVAESRRLAEGELAAKGELSLAVFRDLTHSSRRCALALLEHFDQAGLTRRVGDVRKRK